MSDLKYSTLEFCQLKFKLFRADSLWLSLVAHETPEGGSNHLPADADHPTDRDHLLQRA